MQVLEVPLMVNPSQDEALATQTMAQKGSGKSVTLQQAFCSRTSLHCEWTSWLVNLQQVLYLHNIYIYTHTRSFHTHIYIYIRIKHTFYIMKYNFIWNFVNKLCCIILPSAFFPSRSREKQLASPSTNQVRKLQLKLCFWQIGQCRCTERRCRYCNRIIYIYTYTCIWRFPAMRVPLYLPF